MRNLLIALTLLVPALACARGAETTVVTRTAYFPGGPGTVVVIRGQQATASPLGARSTRITSGKRRLSREEMEAIRRQYKFPKGKFATSQSWTVSYRKKTPY